MTMEQERFLIRFSKKFRRNSCLFSFEMHKISGNSHKIHRFSQKAYKFPLVEGQLNFENSVSVSQMLKVVCLSDTLSHDPFAAQETAGGNDARNTQSRIEKG